MDSIKSGNDRALRIVLLIIFIAVPLANFLLSPVLSDGSQFDDDPVTRVAAAGYAFSIWGVIFSGMLWFVGYLVLRDEPASSHLRVAMLGLCVAGLASIAFVPISIYASNLVGWFDILVHLAALVVAVGALRRHVGDHPDTRTGRWSFFGPSMYLGWISAATVISTSLMAAEQGIVLPDVAATGLAVVVLAGLAGAGTLLILRNDPVYGGTVAWALVAVGVKQEAFPSIRFVAWAGAALVLLVLGYALFDRRAFYAVAGERRQPA